MTAIIVPLELWLAIFSQLGNGSFLASEECVVPLEARPTHDQNTYDCDRR